MVRVLEIFFFFFFDTEKKSVYCFRGKPKDWNYSKKFAIT